MEPSINEAHNSDLT